MHAITPAAETGVLFLSERFSMNSVTCILGIEVNLCETNRLWKLASNAGGTQIYFE